MTHAADLTAWQQHGDVAARNRVVEAHWPRARSIARSWARKHKRNPGDLESAAALGLILSCNKFDASRGVEFGTYAWFYVRREISACLRREQTVVHRRLCRPHLRDLSLDARLCEDGSTWLEMLEAPAVDPVEDIDSRRRTERVRVALAKLGPRERHIVDNVARDRTITAAAERFGISRERGRQLKELAFAQLREELADVAS